MNTSIQWLQDYLMGHGILKNRDAQRMATEIIRKLTKPCPKCHGKAVWPSDKSCLGIAACPLCGGSGIQGMQ